MPNSRPIGIFDSGLGGLTVMKEILTRLPYEDIIYFGDTGRVPYGTRSRDTIRKYAVQDEKFLLNNDVKIIIAACGTVSAVAADTAKDLPVPFFEVISYAAKAAVNATKNGKIGVIGTPATINSGAHKQRILSIMPNADITAVSCPLFVPLVEEGWISRDNMAVYDTAKRYLEPLKSAGIDTLILGCTHYPLLTEVISDIMGDSVTLINMGTATAQAVKIYLEANNMLSDTNNKGMGRFFVSDMTNSFEKTAELLLGKKIDSSSIEQVDIDKI